MMARRLLMTRLPMKPRPHRFDVIDDDMAKVLAAKTGGERLRIASGMFEMARKLVAASVRARYPQLDDADVRREVARRMSHGAV
jgi:hypothetical protein